MLRSEPENNRLLLALLASIEDAFHEAAAAQDELAEHCRQAGLLMQGIRGRAGTVPFTSRPADLPVCRFLVEALENGRKGPAARIAGCLLPLAEQLAWVQNPNYTRDSMGQRFLENYGYTEIIGSRGVLPDDTLALGFLLLGPQVQYPPHHHPAAEIYHVISGAGNWQQAGQSVEERPPGSFIYHAPNVSHTMEARHDALLLLYAWWGVVGVPAQLTNPGRD
jgi:mannose-6-phosphate isomerase-like protein (cupin superfamily)